MTSGIGFRPWAGLDLGSFSVKLLATQGGVGSSRYWLAESPLSPLGTEPSQPPDAESVAKVVADCMSAAGLSPRSFRGISVGIAGPDVIVKQISLPLLDESEVGPALRFEARKHLPFDPQGMIIDYQIIGRFASERKLEILLAAVSQEHVERHCAPLRLLDIEPDILDATPLALANAIAHGSELTHDAHILLDIGHTSSHLSLYQRGQPFFTRRLDFGGRNLTHAISKATQVPFAEAEEWKLAAGADEPGILVDWESPELRAVLDCLRTDLIEELRRSFAFYRTQGKLPEPIRVRLSGGTARLPGLAARVSELLGNPVLLFDPLESLNGSPRGGVRGTAGPQYAQSFGLAMRTT